MLQTFEVWAFNEIYIPDEVGDARPPYFKVTASSSLLKLDYLLAEVLDYMPLKLTKIYNLKKVHENLCQLVIDPRCL